MTSYYVGYTLNWFELPLIDIYLELVSHRMIIYISGVYYILRVRLELLHLEL